MSIKFNYVFFTILILSIPLFAEYDTLELEGKIPGAACACVEYVNGRLYVGAGSTLLIYQSDDPADMILLGSVDFLSLITNIVVRDDNIVFVGANHDGLYAVDASRPDFPVVASYKMPDRDHWVADLEISQPDTLWLSDYTSLKKMIFVGDTFLVEEEYLSGSLIAGAGFRDTLVAVCRRGILNGFVDLYNRAGGGFTHIATFDSSRLWYVVDAEFADNRNDIIYEIAVGANLVFAQPPGDHKDRPYKTKYIWQPDESVGSGVYLVRVTFPQQKASAVCKKVVYLK